MMAKQFGGNDFPTLKKIFSPDNPNHKITLTITVIEDKDNVYEIKVKECLWASTFLQGDLGFVSVCYGDYAIASSFNPRVKMERDKALMQWHAYCNHRYLLDLAYSFGSTLM